MARSKPIESKDIFAPDVIEKTRQDAEKFLHTLNDIIGGFKELKKNSEVSFKKNPLVNSKDLEKAYTDIGNLNAISTQGIAITKEATKAEKNLLDIKIKQEKLAAESIKRKQQESKANQQIIKEINEEAKNSQELSKQKIIEEKLRQQKIKTSRDEFKAEQDLQRAIRQEQKDREKAEKTAQREAKERAKLNSVYLQNVAYLKRLSDRLLELESRGRTNTTTYKLLRQEFEKTDTSVRKAEESVGRFHRSVGSYKSNIKEALRDTGIFNNAIGRLVDNLGDLKRRFEENSKESGKFSMSLKLGAAAAIGLTVAALQQLTKVNEQFGNAVEKFGANIGALLTGGAAGGKAMNEFKDALFASREALRAMRTELQLISLDEEDFREISNDLTIGYKERNAALQESIKLSEERSKKDLEIAQLELDVINKEVKANSIGFRKASAELLDKQAEAQRKVNAALDVQNDLNRQNAALIRQRKVDEAISEVELLRSKKLSYDEQSANLKRQLENEKIQLEERKKIANELVQVQNRTTQEEIKLFKEKTGIQFDTQKLLNETDAVKLANQLKSIQQLSEEGKLVGIGEAAIQELSKVVKQYQENRIENSKNIAKLDEEEIKRQNKLAEIQSDIEASRMEFEIFLSEQSVENSTKRLEKINEELEKNHFDMKLLKKRKLLQDAIEGLMQQEFENERELLEKRAANEQKKIEETVSDEQIKAAEIKRVQEKLAQDLEKLEAQKYQNQKEYTEKTKEDNKELVKQQLKYADDLVDITADALERAAQKRQDAADREVHKRTENIETQQRLAERGLDNTLAFEQAERDKAEQKKEEENKRAIKREKALLFFRLASAYAQDPKGGAVTKAALETALAEVVAGSFFEGTEKVENDISKPLFPGRDGYLIRADGKERILTGDQNAMIGDMSNQELANLAQMYNQGKYLPSYMMMPEKSFADNVVDSLQLNELRTLNRRIESLENTIRNKTEVSYELDRIGDVIKTEVKNGMKQITRIQSSRPRL